LKNGPQLRELSKEALVLKNIKKIFENYIKENMG